MGSFKVAAFLLSDSDCTIVAVATSRNRIAFMILERYLNETTAIEVVLHCSSMEGYNTQDLASSSACILGRRCRFE